MQRVDPNNLVPYCEACNKRIVWRMSNEGARACRVCRMHLCGDCAKPWLTECSVKGSETAGTGNDMEFSTDICRPCLGQMLSVYFAAGPKRVDGARLFRRRTIQRMNYRASVLASTRTKIRKLKAKAEAEAATLRDGSVLPASDSQ